MEFIRREKVKPHLVYESYKFRLHKTLQSYSSINEAVEKQTDQNYGKCND